MIQKIKNKIEAIEMTISPTIDSKLQFEINVRNKFMSNKLRGNLNMLEKHFGYIGQEVNAYEKTFSVTTIAEFESNENKRLNPILPTPFIFSKESFDLFKNTYIEYRIQRLSDELTQNTLYSNSTSPFANLEYQWITESKQDLIKFYKELLAN